MAVYNAWTVEYLNGSTWTAISKVQDLTCTVGRQLAVDQWPASSGSIRIWYPDGYITPIANLGIGTYIRFFAPGRSATRPTWTGIVKNMTIEVGIPWNSATSKGNGDFLTIDVEGYIARALQNLSNVGYTNTYAFSAGLDPVTAQYLTQTVLTNAGLICNCDTSSASMTSTVYMFPWADAGTGSANGDWNFDIPQLLNQACTFGLYRLIDGVRKSWSFTNSAGNTNDPALYFGKPAPYATIATVGFSDTTNDATNRKYDQITFDGLTDMTFNQSTMTYSTKGHDPFDNSGSKSSVVIGSSKPYRGLYNQLPQADPTYGTPYPSYQTMTDYWANEFWPADIQVSAISATTNGQHTQNLDTLGVTDLELGYLPLYVVPVTLRGQTFYCQIEGVTVTADTNQARFTYYVTPTDTTAWFTLDSSTFGVLDANRLGIY